MTFQNLLQEIDGMRNAHPLTPTNIESIERTAGGIVITEGDSGLESELAEARENEAALEKELKAANEEADELTRQLEAEDRKTDEDLRYACQMRDQFRQSATDWAVEVQKAREEVTALRKKKGVMPGLISQQREIMDLLGQLSQYPDRAKFYQNCAKEILSQIRA